ncbi:amino acid adenylation domain-containing protein [Streptomyces sp. NPDC101132]|uniref:amino acid adenylation domain-containing protein n=1 Tax=Streptomyces sp. NPDC101132 TaxID=3366110 RepID=UPI00380593CB
MLGEQCHAVQVRLKTRPTEASLTARLASALSAYRRPAVAGGAEGAARAAERPVAGSGTAAPALGAEAQDPAQDPAASAATAVRSGTAGAGRAASRSGSGAPALSRPSSGPGARSGADAGGSRVGSGSASASAVGPARTGHAVAGDGPWRVWVEDVPWDSHGPAALRRRTAELTRPTASLRCVLLRHTDGVSHLVLVAHRSLLGPAELRDLAELLAGGAGTGHGSAVPGSVTPLAGTGAAPLTATGLPAGGAGAGSGVAASGSAIPFAGAGGAAAANTADSAGVGAGAVRAADAGTAPYGHAAGLRAGTAAAPPATGAPLAAVTAAPAPDWGGGVRGDASWASTALDLPDALAEAATTDPAGLLAALALTLDRYEGHGATGTVAVATGARGAVEFPVPDGATLADLRTAALTGTDRPVVAGLLDTEPRSLTGTGAAPATSYLPCLAPPYPLTLAILPGTAPAANAGGTPHEATPGGAATTAGLLQEANTGTGTGTAAGTGIGIGIGTGTALGIGTTPGPLHEAASAPGNATASGTLHAPGSAATTPGTPQAAAPGTPHQTAPATEGPTPTGTTPTGTTPTGTTRTGATNTPTTRTGTIPTGTARTGTPTAATPTPTTGGRLWAAYRRSHFSDATVTAFLRHLAHVYAQFAATPHLPAADAELLDPAERARVAALGRPATPLTTTPTRLTEAFARIVAATPDAPAVGDGTGPALTYRELDDRATRLARGLAARGVAPGDRVGICLDRTTELVVAMLGVLKAGAAYVPTDPAYPADRLAHTARDAGLDVVVTRLAEYPAEAGTPVTPDDLLTGPAADLPAPAPGTADDPAYVIYTSGSTGRPKGVVVPHRNVVALIDATRDEYALSSSDVWTFFHSGAFDFSVWEIWGCLLTGGRLVVVPYLVSREPEEFRDLLVRERVTVLSQTPSAFSQLLETDHAQVPVRLVVFGGEPLDARMLLRWFDRHPEHECRMVNMFGITETTVHVTHQTLTRELALAGSRSVGPALPGWHLYVADARGRLVPPGVTGEIRVGGAGVALGYLGQPDLTAARFTEDPHTPATPDGIQYHSGDLGRLRPDGALEHLGRIDSQVKIRGFRIELDEIRAVLLEDPDVRAAAVVVRREDPDDPASARLDAYVVPADLDTTGVRKRAATVLPAYMLPATVTALDTLPLTTNGKLDATRLPLPTRAEPAPPVAAAAGDRTAVLQEIWTNILGTPVGPDDDFFELGGNSLLAVRISAALKARGLPPVPLRELFRTPTIRELAGTDTDA